MVSVAKSNAVPTVTEAKIDPADMLRSVIVAGKSTRTAALDLCYRAAGFILLVSHFKDAKAKGYMSRTDAKDYLMKQIKEQAGVQGGMLDLYIRNADKLAGILTGSARMFAPIIQRIGLAATPDEATSILSDWSDANLLKVTARGKDGVSMRALSEALGYSTGRKVSTNTGLNAERAPSRIADAIKQVEKIVTDGDKAGKKVQERVIAAAVVNNVSKPIVYAIEAIKRLTEMAELDAVIQAVQSHKKELQALAKRAEGEVKERADQHARTVARNRKFNKTNKTGRNARRGVEQSNA